ncbi:MAG TPA: class I SAM-dependent methyltransferase [bacterium]|nr:class I SAM-dependent methyltransferase [bacterium]
MKILEKVFWLLVNSPFYPHWLNNLKLNSGNKRIEDAIFGNVLEVGAGDGSRKDKLVEKNKKIERYVATDYSTWDLDFENINKSLDKFGNLFNIIKGYEKRKPMDTVCSATELPFADSSFDSHISFEALEHIDDPYKYFEEAARVTKSGGIVGFSVPFIFRMHGGEALHKKDFFRFTNGFFYKVAEDNNLEVVEIYNNTGVGTSVAQMLNHKMILMIEAGNLAIKILLVLIAPLYFFANNVLGLIIDVVPDKRFATRFHIIFRKK